MLSPVAHRKAYDVSRRPVRIIYFLNGFTRGGAELGLRYLLQQGVFDGCELQVVSIIRGDRILCDEIRELATSVVTLRQNDRMRYAVLPSAALGLSRAIRSFKPDILILSLPQANIIGRIVGRLCRVPRIVSFEHNTHLASRHYERLYRLTSGLVDVMFADCAATARRVVQRLYRRPPGRICLVPLIGFSDSPPPSPVAEDGPVLVCVGRLTAVKNHQAAVRSVALLKQRGIRVRLEIFGDGDGRDALLDLVRELGLESEVSLLGHIPQWWRRRRYDAMIIPSLHEGLCIVALEAMWAVVPVIATKVGGIADYGNDDNMLLLERADPGEIADVVAKLLENPARAEALRRNAQEMVRSTFGAAQVSESLAALNQQLRLFLHP
jgi:glycosyltransferase involved in cell wall biosynthesis